LTGDGFVDLDSLADVNRERERADAFNEDRVDLARRLVRAKAQLKTAEGHGDEPGRVRASYAVEKLKQRLAEVEKLLAAGKTFAPQPTERCDACGTAFRYGKVDVAAAGRAIAERAALESRLSSLEVELVGARNVIVSEQRVAELAGTGKGRYRDEDPWLHRQRVEHTEKRVQTIEQELARARKELQSAGRSR
jgi:hypothetical protein